MKKSIEIKMSEFLHSFFLNFFTVCLLYQHINFSYFLSSFVNSKYCTLSYTNFMNSSLSLNSPIYSLGICDTTPPNDNF